MESFVKEVADTQNHYRSNPKDLIPYLKTLLTYFDDEGVMRFPGNPVGLMTNDGPAGVQQAIDFLETADSLPPLIWSDQLARAAQDHADDIGPNGIVGHTGSDGCSMSDRIERHCDWEGHIGENIDFGQETPQKIMSDLIIDDGTVGRGHRKNIFSPNFKYIGVGHAHHKHQKSAVVFVFAGGVNKKGGASAPSQSSYAPAAKGLTGSLEFDEMLEDIKKGKDPHAPAGTVSTKVQVNTKVDGGKTVKTLVKTYKTKTGDTKTVTLTQTTG